MQICITASLSRQRKEAIMDHQTSTEVFQNMPVPKAVMKNTLPAMVAMLMVLIYNLADTFFIGQTHNPILVAAVSPLDRTVRHRSLTNGICWLETDHAL